MVSYLKGTVQALALMLLMTSGVAQASEIVANPGNEEHIDEEQLRLMLTGKEKFWDSGAEVLIAVLKSDPEVEEALMRYSGMTSSKFRNHWQRIAFSGRGKMPKLFANMEDLIAFVKQNEGAIGIVSSRAGSKQLRRVDLGAVLVSQRWVGLASTTRER